FALRLADSNLNARAWAESVANLLAKKSPERWTDMDEAEFYHQLQLSASRFRRVEALYKLGAKRELNGHACRIALTKHDGFELEDLINWGGLNEDALTSEISELITRNGRRGFSAAVKALWNHLQKTTSPEPTPICPKPSNPQPPA